MLESCPAGWQALPRKKRLCRNDWYTVIVSSLCVTSVLQELVLFDCSTGSSHVYTCTYAYTYAYTYPVSSVASRYFSLVAALRYFGLVAVPRYLLWFSVVPAAAGGSYCLEA